MQGTLSLDFIPRLSQQIDDNQADLTEQLRTRVQNNQTEIYGRVNALAESVATFQDSIDSLNQQPARMNVASNSGLPDFATTENVPGLCEVIVGLDAAITNTNLLVADHSVQTADLVTKVNGLKFTPTPEQMNTGIANTPSYQMLHNQLKGLIQSQDASDSTISAAAAKAAKECPELAVRQHDLRTISQALHAMQAQVLDFAGSTLVGLATAV